MTNTTTVRAGLPWPRLGAGLAVATIAVLATSAYTRDASQPVGFSCEGGDRFVVEIRAEYVRLRDGTGSFSLARAARHEPSATTTAATYTDGELVLRIDGKHASLQRAGTVSAPRCLADARTA